MHWAPSNDCLFENGMVVPAAMVLGLPLFLFPVFLLFYSFPQSVGENDIIVSFGSR